LGSSNTNAIAAPAMVAAADILPAAPWGALVTNHGDVCAYVCAVYTDAKHVR
jgi:hypothetical protein